MNPILGLTINKFVMAGVMLLVVFSISVVKSFVDKGSSAESTIEKQLADEDATTL